MSIITYFIKWLKNSIIFFRINIPEKILIYDELKGLTELY